MTQTTRLALPLLAASQAQKHITHNEALLKLDGLVQMSVLSQTTASQPVSPQGGDHYVLPPGKTGTDWGAASDYSIAHFRDGIWHFVSPAEGWTAFVRDADKHVVFNGSNWSDLHRTLTDGSAAAPALAFASDLASGLFRKTAGEIGFASSGIEVMTVNQAGNQQPRQPAFLSYLTATQADVTGDDTDYTVPFDGEVFDQGGNFNTSSGIFTAPIGGRYLLAMAVRFGDCHLASGRVIVFIDTSNRLYRMAFLARGAHAPGGNLVLSSCVVADLDAGDTARVIASSDGGTKSVDIIGGPSMETYFSGCLLA